MRLTPLLLPLVFATLVLSGCSTQSVTGAEKVKAMDNMFSPNTLTIIQNDKVEWTNTGQNEHNIDIHKAGDPVTTHKKETDIEKSASTDYTFSDVGTYHVFCKYHAPGGLTGNFNDGMVMTVTVKAK